MRMSFTMKSVGIKGAFFLITFAIVLFLAPLLYLFWYFGIATPDQKQRQTGPMEIQRQR